MSLIVAETHDRSEEIGEWGYKSDYEHNDSESGSGEDSDSDWNPNDQPKLQDRSSNKDEAEEASQVESKPSKAEDQKIRVFNTECNFVQGRRAGHSSLLDPEGNRYRKGRTRGDKAYWRCTYVNQGCTVTAITHGFTLVSTRGEHINHIKPVHGNTKRMEERLSGITRNPGPFHPNSNKAYQKWGIKAEFTKGKVKGHYWLTDPMGQHYRKGKQRGNIIYYQCVKRHNGCTARAIVVNDILESTSGPHLNHEEESVYKKKKKELKKEHI